MNLKSNGFKTRLVHRMTQAKLDSFLEKPPTISTGS